MATTRAFLSCCDYLAFLNEERLNDHASQERRKMVSGIAEDLVLRYFSADGDWYRSHSGSDPNLFTDAQALVALSACLSPNVLGTESLRRRRATRMRLFRNHRRLTFSLLEQLLRYGTSDYEPGANSAFVTLHVVRALDVAARTWPVTAPDLAASNTGHFRSRTGSSSETRAVLNSLIRTEARHRYQPRLSGKRADNRLEKLHGTIRLQSRDWVLRQLGMHSGRDPEFDPGSLLAAVCLLQRFAGRSARNLVRRGIDVLKESQDEDGSWRADIITIRHDHLIYVSSLEMATSLANIAIADVSTGATDLLPAIDEILLKCFPLFEAGYIDLGAESSASSVRRGWGNDRTRQSNVVEVWATALAMQFLMRLHRLRHAARQHDILTGYQLAGDRPVAGRWPDLDPVVPDPARTGSSLVATLDQAMLNASDPSAERQIVRTLKREIVEPTVSSSANRPTKAASFLLYGPPGTRKTSLVKSLAEALGWQVVVISPPTFLVGGIESLERRAEEIFGDLTQLRRVVILFDECEELFRRRLPVGAPESRTHGAFITSGMLPRLTDLRDRSWVVFAIVTNTELDELDPAITRQGRLDLRLRIGHPEVRAQTAYLIAEIEGAENRSLTGREKIVISDALERYYEEQVAEEDRRLRRLRRRADERLRATGNLRKYFDTVAKLRIMEAEHPRVTFAVLDAVGERCRGRNVSMESLARLIRTHSSGGRPVLRSHTKS